MSDTQFRPSDDNNDDKLESVEHQRVHNLLHESHLGLEALDATGDVESPFPYAEVLAALIEGHQVLARHFSSLAEFVEALWPERVGRHATVTAAQISAASLPLASLYGQVTCLPMASATAEPRDAE